MIKDFWTLGLEYGRRKKVLRFGLRGYSSIYTRCLIEGLPQLSNKIRCALKEYSNQLGNVLINSGSEIAPKKEHR